MISDFKKSVDAQFQAAVDILDVAKDLHMLRRRLEAEGKTDEAEAVRQAVGRLLARADCLTAEGRAGGKSVVEAIRDSW